MKTKGNPPGGSIGERSGKLNIIAQVKGKFNAIHWTFDSHTRYFAVALQRMSITCREQRSRNNYGEIECTTRYQFFAVHIPAAKARRKRCKQPGLIRWHAHNTHKWTKRERMPILISPSHC